VLSFKRTKQSQTVLLGILAVLFLLTIGIWLSFSLYTFWPGETTKVVFCDVGQGDAALIIAGFTQVLIDSGPDPYRLQKCLDAYVPWYDSKLELVVVSHPDFDHMGAVEAVLEPYFIQSLMLVEDAKDTNDFVAFREFVLRKESQGTELLFPVAGEEGRLTSAVSYLVHGPTSRFAPGLTAADGVYSPGLTETKLSALLDSHAQKISNYNERSLSLELDIHGTSVLFTGDIENHAEEAIAGTGLLKQINILKVAHHGAKTSSSANFLEKIRPEHAIISVGGSNQYGHPAEEVVTRLEEVGARVWRTDLQGEICVLISEGSYEIAAADCSKRNK